MTVDVPYPGARELAEAARREAAELVQRAAEPRAPAEKIKVSITRAAKKLGWSYRRTEDIWRQEARRIDSWEMDLLRRMARRRRHRRSRQEQRA
jgi:hypothetical protein